VRRGAVSRFRVRHAAKVRVIINQSVRRGCIGMEKVSKMIQPCATTLRWVTCRSSFERRVYTKHSNRQQNAFESGACQPRVVAVLAPGDSQRQWPKDFQTVPITRTSKVGDGERVCSWLRGAVSRASRRTPLLSSRRPVTTTPVRGQIDMWHDPELSTY
jgi:hypothetical protein